MRVRRPAASHQLHQDRGGLVRRRRKPDFVSLHKTGMVQRTKHFGLRNDVVMGKLAGDSGFLANNFPCLLRRSFQTSPCPPPPQRRASSHSPSMIAAIFAPLLSRRSCRSLHFEPKATPVGWRCSHKPRRRRSSRCTSHSRPSGAIMGEDWGAPRVLVGLFTATAVVQRRVR
jgi:hypothetical protein